MTPFNNPLIRFVSDRKYSWLRHTLFILGGLILAYKGDIAVPNDRRPPEFVRAIIIYDTITFMFIMGMLYLMILVLIPRLLFRSKVFLFSLSFFAMLVLIYLLVWFIDDRFIRPIDNFNSNMQHIELEEKVELRTRQLQEAMQLIERSRDDLTKALDKDKELSDLSEFANE